MCPCPKRANNLIIQKKAMENTIAAAAGTNSDGGAIAGGDITYEEN